MIAGGAREASDERSVLSPLLAEARARFARCASTRDTFLRLNFQILKILIERLFQILIKKKLQTFDFVQVRCSDVLAKKFFFSQPASVIGKFIIFIYNSLSSCNLHLACKKSCLIMYSFLGCWLACLRCFLKCRQKIVGFHELVFTLCLWFFKLSWLDPIRV